MQKLIVAIVEDDEDDREFISSSIREKNKDVELMTFSSGSSFLEYIKTANTLPTLIITDLKMPVVSGFDVIQTVKSDSKHKDITVIVLSTSGNESDIKRAKELGAAGYYVKPYSFTEYGTITDKIVQVLRTGFYPFSKMKEEFFNTFYALLPVHFFIKAAE